MTGVTMNRALHLPLRAEMTSRALLRQKAVFRREHSDLVQAKGGIQDGVFPFFFLTSRSPFLGGGVCFWDGCIHMLIGMY